MKKYNSKEVLQNVLNAIKQCDDAIQYINASDDKDKKSKINEWNKQKSVFQNLLKY